MEQDPKWVVYLNIVLALIFKLGFGSAFLAACWKALDGIQGWVAHKLEMGKAKANEFVLLQHTQVDDKFFDVLADLTFSTFKNLKEGLKADLADGKITREEYIKTLHDDVKKNFKAAVPKGKREIFEQAYEDIEAVIDVKLPGVVKHVKDLARSKVGVNGDVVAAVEAAEGKNS